MTSSDESSILAAWTEYRLRKEQISTFKILVKPQDFVVKHYVNIIYIYVRIRKYIFFKYTLFEIIFVFSFWNKNFKILKRFYPSFELSEPLVEINMKLLNKKSLKLKKSCIYWINYSKEAWTVLRLPNLNIWLESVNIFYEPSGKRSHIFGPTYDIVSQSSWKE